MNPSFRSITAWSLRALLFPVVITMTLALMYFGTRAELPAPALQLAVFVVAILAGVLAERVIPHRVQWRQSVGSDRRVDALSFATMLFLVDPFLKAVTPILLSTVVVAFAAPSSLEFFPTGLPFVAQVFVAAAIAEFGPYWLHRLAHRGGYLWRIHSIHHSARRIYWLNSYRSHPLNIAWHYLAGAFALLAIGTPLVIVQSHLALAAAVSVFQHCNADLRHGFLNYVFSTNEVHRWHHSTNLAVANNNFGNVLMIWDLVFGSFYYRHGKAPGEVGLTMRKQLPVDNYLRLLAAPFQARFWR